jgi:hypothetical protein
MTKRELLRPLSRTILSPGAKKRREREEKRGINRKSNKMSHHNF